jgi:hypothetical protein
VGIGAVALTAIVASIYRDVTRTYNFNDDFQWLQGRANPAPLAGAIVYADRENANGVPELYLNPAAEVASCGPDVHVVVR